MRWWGALAGVALEGSAMRGTLILVVGPSGAGKDTLIDGARAALAGDPRFVFARREITRPAGSAGEAHAPVDLAAFAARRAAGGYLLAWEAHGLGYGLPAGLGEALAAGRHVVANVSRAVVADAAERLPPVAVIAVTAPAELLAARLASRAREGAVALAGRLARQGAPLPAGVIARTIANDGSVAEGIARFRAAIEAAAEGG